jgi:adenylate cyclase
MERSEEIRRVVERWFIAASVGDSEEVLARVSEHPGMVWIGTDPNEWLYGEEHRMVTQRQYEESGGFPMTPVQIDAWEEGTCGWASVKVQFEAAGVSYDARFTCVAHLEQGDWKVVQAHLSLPQSNESIGMTLTTTIEELEQTVQREQPDLSASVAVDGTVTIAFTDVVDSTVMLSRVGDLAWLEVIRRHNALMEDVTATYGGTVVETQGDGSMLAFSSARQAVACARAIQHEVDRTFAHSSTPIRIRVGIHTGDAIQEGDHYFGTTVHYAARVASHAVAGEVLVSNLVRELVAASASDFTFREGEEVELKGLQGRHRLYALVPG